MDTWGRFGSIGMLPLKKAMSKTKGSPKTKVDKINEFRMASFFLLIFFNLPFYGVREKGHISMQTQSILSVQSQVTTRLNHSVTVSARALSQNLLYAQDSVVQLGRGSKEGKKDSIL